MGFIQDYMEGVMMRKNPALLQQKMAQMQAQQMAGQAENLYGTPAQSEVRELQAQNMEGPLRPGQTRPTLMVNQEMSPAVPGTKMFDESVPLQQRMMQFNKDMLGTGIEGFNKQWAGNQANMQNSSMSGLQAMARQIQAQRAQRQNPTATSAMKNLQARGLVPGSEAYQQAMTKHMNKSGVNINMGKTGEPMKTGDLKQWQVPDGKGGFIDASPGMSMADVGKLGGKLKPSISTEAAGKYMMLRGSQEELPQLKSLLFKEDGAVNRDTLFGTTLEDLDPFGGAAVRQTPWSTDESQMMTGIFERGMQGITRTETGAAMPAEEVVNTKKRFMPSSTMNDAAIKNNFKAYEYFINNAVDLMNPQGLKRSQISPALAKKMLNDGIDKAFAAVADQDEPYEDEAKEARYQAWKAEQGDK